MILTRERWFYFYLRYQSTLKLYIFDDCVPYRSETTRWVFHVSAFPIKPRQKRRLGESFATLSEDSASSATAEGRAKMQRQAISLGVVAPVVLARRRVAATPAATLRAPQRTRNHFLGRRPGHGVGATARAARASRGRRRGARALLEGGVTAVKAVAAAAAAVRVDPAPTRPPPRASKASSRALATRAISSQSSTPTATRSTPSTPPPPSIASPRTPRATPRANPSRRPRPSRRSWTSSAPISAA